MSRTNRALRRKPPPDWDSPVRVPQQAPPTAQPGQFGVLAAPLNPHPALRNSSVGPYGLLDPGATNLLPDPPSNNTFSTNTVNPHYSIDPITAGTNSAPSPFMNSSSVYTDPAIATNLRLANAAIAQNPTHNYSASQMPLAPQVASAGPTAEPTRPNTSFTGHGYTSAETSIDNDLDGLLFLPLHHNSPRPKGPVQLPFDDVPSSSGLFAKEENSTDGVLPSSQSVPLLPRTRHSHADHSGEPISHSESPLDASQSDFRARRFQNLSQRSALSLPNPFNSLKAYPKTSPVLPGRPTANKIQFSDLEDEANTSANPPYPVTDLTFSDDEIDSSMGPQSPANPAHGTPTRIPTLIPQAAIARLPEADTLLEYKFLRLSPPLAHLALSSPDLPFSSALTSPTKQSLYRPLTYAFSPVLGTRSSRSPSPKKVVPGTASRSFVYEEEDYNNNYDYGERIPRWSLIEDDPVDDLDDVFTPQTPGFDYSFLPELPRQPTEAPAPTQLHSTLTMKRKHEALPPVPLDLPLLPFTASSLTAQHFTVCTNVWSLKALYQWCVKLSGWMHDGSMLMKDFRKALIKLLAYHRLDIPVDLISRNARQIIQSFTAANLFQFLDDTKDPSDNQSAFTIALGGEISGVLVDLTACYCLDQDHVVLSKRALTLKCYSSKCQMNQLIEHELLMRKTKIQDIVLATDWASHWKLTPQDMSVDLAESKRQSLLFDLIKFEQTFIQRANCFIEIAGPEFIKLAKVLVSRSYASQMKEFEEKILTAASELSSVHREVLFEPLLQILVSDGKFIKNIAGISDLYYKWSKAAKTALLNYISVMPMIEDLLSKQALKKWDESIRSNQRMKELLVNGNLLLMSTFNSRYQQLPLQLRDIRKSFDEEDDEYAQLTKAIDGIKALGSKVNSMKVYADNVHSLKLIERQLVWKSTVYQPDLNLRSENRKFFYRGDLLKKGDLVINTSTVHVILFDNFLLITDRQKNQGALTYKVNETPVPMDYLVFENREDNSNAASKAANTQGLGLAEADEETSTYPFKVRYAGQGKSESHTLIASSEKERQRWFAVLQQARANHIRRISAKMPYLLTAIENSFFAAEFGVRARKIPILAENDPIALLCQSPLVLKAVRDPRLQQVEANVLCATMFTYEGTKFTFLGTSSGVCCSDGKNIWKKIIKMTNVTKITAIPELNVVLALGNKVLRYYPLQLLINIYYERQEKIVSYQLSNDSIAFYEYGCHASIPTLFVAKKKNAGTTTFKVFVLELDNDGIMSNFTVIKRFYIQAECSGVSIFNSSIAVHTQRGFEVLDLNKLSPRTVPELPNADTAGKKLDSYSRRKSMQSTEGIRKIITHASPMGMFKLSNNKEFLLVYSDCAVFVNKSGKLLRVAMIRFNYRAKSIAFENDKLFVICEEVIEVWQVQSQTNGSGYLIQVLACRDIHLLDSATLSFKMVNPMRPETQLVFRMGSRAESAAGH